jgi:hypothetical protein
MCYLEIKDYITKSLNKYKWKKRIIFIIINKNNKKINKLYKLIEKNNNNFISFNIKIKFIFIPNDAFTLLLYGLDGTLKYKSTNLFDNIFDNIFKLIDKMTIRKDMNF